MQHPIAGAAPAAGMRTLLLAALCAVGLPDCHPLARTAAEEPRAGDVIVIDSARIANLGARTAWEAVKRGAPELNYTQDAAGEPLRIQRRGRSSLYLDDTPMLIVDGVHISDISALQYIPCEQVSIIRILTGLAATTEYGTRAGGGAIVVETKNGTT
ncbi:MAG TPA: Plug domain-containing protein [Gemmatimonadales bacterium]|nr:Plug domain-containing protein [Gemmatimonadales bacterium]